MAIHFTCRQCGKALFAQEQYAGRAVKCPGCQNENLIPAPREGIPLPPSSAEEKSQPELMDMEKAHGQPGDEGRAACNPNSVLNAQHSVFSTQNGQEPAQTASIPAQQAPVAEEATKPCPMCAEVIKAAAKKCRYCGALLDEELKAEQARLIEEQVLAGFAGDAERSAHTWRVLAIVVTTITTAWLVLLTMMTWQKAPPTFAVFNLLLAAGLAWNTAHMRHGPASVFLAAAAAVLFCMPIDAILGLALVDAETLKRIQSQDPQQYANLTTDSVNAAFGLVFTFAGVLFSVPVWIAAVKVAVLQRARTTK